MKHEDVEQGSPRGILHQIIGFSIKHRKIMQNYLDETGVYQSQHRLLMEISHHKSASQKDLARSMKVSAATIAVSLKKLEKGGYIHKETDKGDNRLNRITITEKGDRVVKQSKQIFRTTNQKVFEGLSENERCTLSELLRKLDGNLNKMDDEINSKSGRT